MQAVLRHSGAGMGLSRIEGGSATLELRLPALDERADAFLGILRSHDLLVDRRDGGDRQGFARLDVVQRRFLHGAQADRREFAVRIQDAAAEIRKLIDSALE